jgi:hypothetical protein
MSITKPLLLELAECIVPFLISSSNSLNAHLKPTETKNIELRIAAIVSELLLNYPSTVQSMYEFAHSTKRFTYIYIYIHIYVSIYVHMYEYIHMYKYIYVDMYECT